jgi:CubicO group peptidase (beta-lactamase class C family)
MPVRHVMTYTSGLGYEYDYPPEVGLRHVDVLGPGPGTATGMRRLATFPLPEQPGSRWRYGFSGDLLGRMIEVVAGRPLDAVMAELVLEPSA